MRAATQVRQLSLELTGRCQLACTHCYAESSPLGGHGAMTGADWQDVLEQAAALGIPSVQFIGGEPTLHPDFMNLVKHASDVGFQVEVFTNLVRVPRSRWELFERCRVSLATSYYTPVVERHDLLTGLPGSHERTRANIAEAVRRGLRIRVGVVDVGGDAEAACADLRTLGVRRIHTAGVQAIGRAAARVPSEDDLCGSCALGRAAINPEGDVTPCPMARWIRVGNVRLDDLAEILAGPRMATATADLSAAFCRRPVSCDCNPCGPSP